MTGDQIFSALGLSGVNSGVFGGQWLEATLLTLLVGY